MLLNLKDFVHLGGMKGQAKINIKSLTLLFIVLKKHIEVLKVVLYKKKDPIF